MIKVLNLKDLIRSFAKIIVPLLILFIIVQVINNSKRDENKKAMLFPIEHEFKEALVDNKEADKTSFGQKIIDSQFRIFEDIENNEKEIEEENEEVVAEITKEKEIEESNINEDAQVEEVNNSGIEPKSTDEYKGIRINNTTDYTLTEDMLNTDNLKYNKSKILIYHTHTCESYTPTETCNYEQTGNFRSTDLSYSVARVGDELENELKKYNIEVIHSKAFHDYPSYTGSYSRSLQTAEDILKDNRDIDISIDIHRDAIGDETYAPKVKIGDEYVSQLLFVMGTDLANEDHKNWLENLRFVIKLEQKANELYPGLFKPIILRKSEYNQHISKAACLLEVGATGNTLEESMGAMKYFAKIINEM